MKAATKFLFEESTHCAWGSCKRVFDTASECLAHIRSEHLEHGMTACQWRGCQKISTSRCNLSNHLPKHLKIVVEICHVCAKSFKWRGDYSKHTRLHNAQQIRFNEIVNLLFQ